MKAVQHYFKYLTRSKKYINVLLFTLSFTLLFSSIIFPSAAEAPYDDDWYAVEFDDWDFIGEYICELWLRTDSLILVTDDRTECWIKVEEMTLEETYDCEWSYRSKIVYVSNSQLVERSGESLHQIAYDYPYSSQNFPIRLYYDEYPYDSDLTNKIVAFGDFFVENTWLPLTINKIINVDFALAPY